MVACSFMLEIAVSCAPESGDASKARLSLGVFGSESWGARGFLPGGLVITSIRIEGSGPSGLKVDAESGLQSPAYGRFELELEPGGWSFKASGRNKDGIEIAAGSLDLVLAPDESTSCGIALLPVQGSGSLSLSWSLSASLASPLEVSGNVKKGSGEALPIQSAFEAGPIKLEGLASGRYELELRLFSDGNEVCGLADSILIVAGMETAATVAFDPPASRLCLEALLPLFSAGELALRPARRRVSVGQATSLEIPASAPVSWYIEGRSLACSAARIELPAFDKACQRHVDCLVEDGLPGGRGRSILDVCAAVSLGPLAWAETLVRDDEKSTSPAYAKGLGDCRSVAWSADSSFLALAGRDSDSISLLALRGAGSAYVVSSLGGLSEARLDSPNCLAFRPSGDLVAASGQAATVYSVKTEGSKLSLASSLIDPLMAGAADLVITPEGDMAYIAATEADRVLLIRFGSAGAIESLAAALAPAEGDLASFDGPACLALDPTGTRLAVGTKGDDAIYIFYRSPTDGSLAFASRLGAEAFSTLGSLSDPCSLSFSYDGNSLYVLSYYGKTLFRLDAGSGSFSPVAAAKSGASAVTGFASPKRLAASPDGRLVAVVGGGSADGLALFDTATAGCLVFTGTLLPSSGVALPDRPSYAAFSPSGAFLAVAAEGRLSIFTSY